MDDEKFWTLWPEMISGAEGDEDQSDDGDYEADEGDEDGEASSDSDDAIDEASKTAEDVAKLQKALAGERRITKRLERENKRLKVSKTEEEIQEKTDLETEQNRAREAVQRAEKLASGLLQRDLNSAIEQEARALGFLDPDDAISGVDRTQIDYDQDEEDPTDIDIDRDTVKAAVKALATKKPHYLTRGTDDGEPTGSPFGRGKKIKKNEEDVLRELYPSL